jgi:hypothetical protein
MAFSTAGLANHMSDREEFRDGFSLHLLRRESQTSNSWVSFHGQDFCKFYNVSVAAADKMKQSWGRIKRTEFFLLESRAYKQ